MAPVRQPRMGGMNLKTGKVLNPNLATPHKWAEERDRKLDVGLSSY